MKVLNIPTNGVRREGINSMQLRWTQLIDKTNLQLDIAAVHDNAKDVIKDYEKMGSRVFVLPDRQSNIIKYSIALFKLIRQERYDVIHVHGSSSIIAIELFIARIAGAKKRIAHSRNTTCDHKKIDRILRPLLYWNMTYALACSDAAGKWLFGNHQFEVIHNGINASIYKFDGQIRKQVRKRIRVDDNALILGFAGNIKEQKNPLFLVDVFAEYYNNNNNSYLLIVGDGILLDSLKAKVKSLNIENNVIFAGRTDKVHEYMDAMDVFLFPSLYEGFGNVALEAQISGLPVLVSESVPRDCGLTKLVKFISIDNGTSEWVKEIENTKIRDDQDRIASYTVICKRMKEAHFDLEENVKRLRQLYFG